MLLLKNNEIKTNKKEIEEFEKEYNLKLPEDFVLFLVETNGGNPIGELYTPPFDEVDPKTNERHIQETDIDNFFSFNEIKFEYGDVIDEGYIPSEYVPLARSSFDNLFLIRLDDSESYGSIYFANHDLFDEENNRITISKIADSFSAFVDSLKANEEWYLERESVVLKECYKQCNYMMKE